MNVRPLLRGELETAAATLTLAFDEDPMFCHLLPRPATRAKWLRWFHRALNESFAVGYVLGVHPSQKGRGLGGALLCDVEGIAKSERVVAHLETSNPDNLGLYRRFGYEVQEEITAHGGPPLWTMTTAPT